MKQPGQAAKGLEAGRKEKQKAAFIPSAAVWRNPENLRATRINLGNFKVQAITLVLLVGLRVPAQRAEFLLRECPGPAQSSGQQVQLWPPITLLQLQEKLSAQCS